MDDATIEEKAAAAKRIADWGGRDAITILTGALATAPDDLKPVIQASIDGLKGVMCIFDDFVAGTEDFGRNVMPLLHCR